MANPKAEAAPAARKSTRVQGGLYLHARGGSKVKGLSVPVRSEAVATLSRDPGSIGKIADTFSQAMNGLISGFVVRVDRYGTPSIEPLPAPRPYRAKARASEKSPLEAARDRGQRLAAEILSGSEMLAIDEFADKLGVSHTTINSKRQRNELLALKGTKRGYRFPEWQIDDDGRPIAAMPRLFELLGSSPWGVYRFLTQRHAGLKATAREALLKGRDQEVLDAAESLARGDPA